MSGLVRIDPGAAGRGLALSVRPAWGQTSSGVNRLWETDAIAGVARTDQMAGRMSTEIGYGLGVAPGLGVVTPLCRARARWRRRTVVAHGYALGAGAGREPEF